MTKKLVFIHGRAQQNKDSAALKGEWIAAFRKGLESNGLELPIPESDIRFPYYGDTLDQLAHGGDPAKVAAVIVRGGGPANEAERTFIQSVVEEVREKAGITDDQIDDEIPEDVKERGPLNWSWVQAILKVIDRHVPLGSGASIALFTRDVYKYLTNFSVRDAIDGGVRQAINSNEPTVVVSHSLGTIVAYSILAREGKERHWQVPALITVGSPLGVTRIRQTLAPVSQPSCVSSWFNALDERDVVALYPLQKPYFDVSPATIRNKRNVDNQTENRHGISGYLNDPEIAKWVYDAIQ